VLRRIFGPKRDEVTGEWKRLHNEELYALYSSPNNVRLVKSRRTRCVGHVVHRGVGRGKCIQREGDHLKDLGIDGWIILKCMFGKWDGSVDCIDLAQGRDIWLAPMNAVTNLWIP
jgi:hypothetical protein